MAVNGPRPVIDEGGRSQADVFNSAEARLESLSKLVRKSWNGLSSDEAEKFREDFKQFMFDCEELGISLGINVATFGALKVSHMVGRSRRAEERKMVNANSTAVEVGRAILDRNPKQ